jgi:hypothetical protein
VNTENAEDEIREAFKVFDGVSITNLLTVVYFYVLVQYISFADKPICCLAMYIYPK